MLLLCYLVPPLAVLLMGRPVSAFFNFFLWCFGIVPGIGHALVCYADYKSEHMTRRVERAINNPHWAAEPAPRRRRASSEREVVVVYDNPHVGRNGTYFRPKSN